MNELSFDSNRYFKKIDETEVFIPKGKITRSIGLIFEAQITRAAVGSHCIIESDDGPLDAEVVGFRDKRALIIPFLHSAGVHQGCKVYVKEQNSKITIGPELMGRVIDPMGRPLDGKGPIEFKDKNCERRFLYQKPVEAMQRKVIHEPLDLGIRVINGLLTCGKGQRLGIMAGSGVGKSVLLGMMAKNTAADVNVIALIGERGREVREFIEKDLGSEGLSRSVVIVATSDLSPLLRTRGAFLSTVIAEYFRDQQKDVLLMMDSVTRFCMAQREIGLAMGEPPATKGYTPSVFSLLPKLLERAGTCAGNGSITGLYTVLVEGDDMDEPIADSARSILDGHIVLTRNLVTKNHFPAIDVLQSTSRVMNQVVTEDQKKWSATLKEWIASYAQVEDLINIGAYAKGSNKKIDESILMHEKVIQFLKQGIQESVNYASTLEEMRVLIQVRDAKLAASASSAGKA